MFWFRSTGRRQFRSLQIETIKGNGPCNAERLAVRRMAEERGRWVREALRSEDSTYVTPLA